MKHGLRTPRRHGAGGRHRGSRDRVRRDRRGTRRTTSRSSRARSRPTGRRRSARTRRPPPSSSGEAGASGVKVTVGISGTGGGFQRFCKGETDLSDASRPMRAQRGESCKDNNIGSWRAFTVANDALTVVVNQQNTWATCLTVAELKKIWEPGSKVNNWRDVRSSFPDGRSEALRAGNRLRDVRVLHRGDQRQSPREPHRLPGLRGRQRARPGRLG